MVRFQVSVSRLVCLETHSTYNSMRPSWFSRTLFAQAARELGFDLGPKESHDLYYLIHDKNKHTLVITSVRSMTFYSMVHSLLYRSYSDEGLGRVALYPLPGDIVLQASEMVVQVPILRDMCRPTLPLRKQNDTVLIFCKESSKRNVLVAWMLPQIVFQLVLTRKVNISGKKYLGRYAFELTNAQIGTVNRPQLCIYPALILLAILVLLCLFSRIWCSEGNRTLQLWQSRTNILDINDSSNPVFPCGTETIMPHQQGSRRNPLPCSSNCKVKVST